MTTEHSTSTLRRDSIFLSERFEESPVGWIPSDWWVKQLAETASREADSFTDGDWIETPHIRQQGIRLVQTGNIGIGEFLDRRDDRKFISRESFTALRCKGLRPGDILICRLAEPVGRACIVPEEISEAITAVDVTIFRPDRHVLLHEFAIRWLNTEHCLAQCTLMAGGTTRKRISRLNLGKLWVAAPSVAEQSRIAAVLDMVDEAIAQTEAVIAKLK